MNWLHYLLEANLYLAIFYLGYLLFLSRETWYTLNRVYLLISCVLSFIIPVVQLGVLKPAEPVVTVTNLVLSEQGIRMDALPAAPIEHPFTMQDGLWYAYLTGVIILLLVLLLKLLQLAKLAKAAKSKLYEDYKLVYLDNSDTAFSFFNYLFIGAKTRSADTIINHELVHIRQKHSFDIVFLELIKIINWFNPFIYLLQHSIRAIHEYIADEQAAILVTDKVAYSAFLVDNAYGLSGSTLANSFFNYNLLKRRIIMLNQKRSGSLARLKYLLAVPVCAGLLCASTLAFSKTYGWVDIAPAAKPDTAIHAVKKSENQHITNWDKNYTTSKGYKVYDHIELNNGIVIQSKATIIDKDGTKHVYNQKGLSAGELKMLSDKYGYQFPKGDTIKTVKLLPPPPPAPPLKSAKPLIYSTTARGYRYNESGYLVNGKTDYRVLIQKKNGTEKAYWKSKASPAEIKMLKDVYGYSFPTMQLYGRMPPPPPMAPKDIHKFPPPVVSPNTVSHKLPPPPPAPPVKSVGATSYDSTKYPKSYSTLKKIDIPITRNPDKISLNEIEIAKDKPTGYKVDDTQTFYINGQEYYITGKLPLGEHLQFSATDSIKVDKRHKAGITEKNGTMYLYGRVSIAVVKNVMTTTNKY